MRRGMIAVLRRWRRLGIVLMLGLLGGCGSGEPPQQTADDPSPPQATAAPPAASIAVDLVDHAELLERIAARRGQVVILDCWSTSCPPCIKEFPGLVALARDFGAKVACLSLSFDYEGFGTPEEVLPPVREFLTDVGATNVENLLGREDSDTLYEKLQLTSVPAVYVYGPEGKLRRRFDDDYAAKELGRPFTYADVRGLVAATLAEKAGPAAAATEDSR